MRGSPRTGSRPAGGRRCSWVCSLRSRVFLGEKLTLLVQAVGLPELALGRATFVPSGAGGVELLALALAPLALHCVTASISSLGARRSKRGYLFALLGAIGVHAAYNLTVVSALV